MILILIILLLLFGLFQSLLELRKEDATESKWNIRRILSLIYVGGFVIGIIICVIQEQETSKINQLIEGISTSVTKIDSVDKRLVEVLGVKDSLITQYERVNAKLSKQAELDMKSLEERSPSIALMDYDIDWKGNDSTSYSIAACIRNLGKRNALITSGRGYVLFFDKDNKPFFHVDIPGNNNKGILESNEIERMRLCYNSHGINSYQTLKANTSFAVIYLEIHYEDVLLEKKKVDRFYSGWSPKLGRFGGLRDWQTNLAQKWASDNHK